MSITIRNASNQDCDTAKRIVFDVLGEFALEPSPGVTDADLEDIETSYVNNGGRFYIVDVDGLPVATLGLYRVDDTICELRKMYIVPPARGRGLGKQLLELAIQTARDLGFKTMILETATPLVTARALYQKYGFTEYFPEHLSARCDQAFRLDL